jgi:hypothetical protein
MTTFTMQDLNNIPVTKEEEEAMDALSRLATGRPLLDITPTTQDALNNLAIPQPPTTKPDLDEIINAISAQLHLLASVIKEKGTNVPTEGAGTDVPNLQDCVSTTLQQAEWFKEAVEEKVETLVDDMDHSYEIESAVETYFSNSFSLDDHVDITAEVESKVEDIAEDLLKDMVEERLAEIVSNKLQNLRITFD